MEEARIAAKGDRVLVGWIIRRWRTRTIEYANGAGGWVAERRRAFVFTNAVGSRSGLNDGLRWAREHREVLGGGRIYRLYRRHGR